MAPNIGVNKKEREWDSREWLVLQPHPSAHRSAFTVKDSREDAVQLILSVLAYWKRRDSQCWTAEVDMSAC